MRGSTFKRCPCGVSGTPGKTACRKQHGSWYWRADAEVGATKRKQPGKGGYPTREDAQKDLNDHLKAVQDGTWTDDQSMTVETWLTTWLENCRARIQNGTMEEKTYVGYESSVRTVLIPHLGQRRLRDLKHRHVEQMISDARTPVTAEPPADRDRPRVRCTAGPEETKSGRPCGKWANVGFDRCYLHGGGESAPRRGRVGRVVETRAATTLGGHRRILRNALNAAVRRNLIATNPAEGLIESMPKEGRPDTKWWEPEQVGAFLLDLELDVMNADPQTPEWAAAVQEDAIYEVAALAGLRRGELGGLPWAELDLASAHPGVNVGPQLSQLAGDHTCYLCQAEHRGLKLKPGPKTRAGWRWAPLVAGTTQKLLTHRASQAKWRDEWGPAYVDHGLVFCREDGNPLSPESITERFQERAARLGLPRIRLHDTRHGAASLLLAAGMPIETVAMIIGHAQVSTVRDIYAHVLKAPSSKGMEAAVALVRGDRRAQSVHSPAEADARTIDLTGSGAGQSLIH